MVRLSRKVFALGLSLIRVSDNMAHYNVSYTFTRWGGSGHLVVSVAGTGPLEYAEDGFWLAMEIFLGDDETDTCRVSVQGHRFVYTIISQERGECYVRLE